MKVSSYTEIGKRELNEDFIAQGTGIYVLCDGVGGEEKGEVASCFVAEKLVDYFRGNKVYVTDKALIQKVLKNVQIELNERLTVYPEEHGMGTTLTAALFSKGKVFLIHIGDSRIYYIRPSVDLFWRTTDHSVIAELVQSGLITEDEARTHPMRNMISRAIQSNLSGNTSKADITCMPNIKAGDLVFLCSDGVLEALTEPGLLEILCDNRYSINEKTKTIKKVCFGLSNDNNSAILIEIEPDDEFQTDQNIEIIWKKIHSSEGSSFQEEGIQFKSTGPEKPETHETGAIPNPTFTRLNKIVSIAIAIFLILVIAVSTFSFCQRQKTTTHKSAEANRIHNQFDSP